ncbi:hypothetical protein THTE_0357 [Thermogutta terrifontis]|uniref:Uncharacterized protein n=1 Tax=Thermogutta terrifontis TaxID=1331910 RepID=A0A286RAH8_9BACT|nr:hypothetical protein THTE_0357 [Thermogutta terrifontis]
MSRCAWFALPARSLISSRSVRLRRCVLRAQRPARYGSFLAEL